jgi:16S rRNA (cytidine1402-2'-O)-methyltransferase
MANKTAEPGRLVLVTTPIGNLGDLSPRAVEALRAAALICCEDTRRTGRLLQHAGVPAPRLAVCNEHTEPARVADVLAALERGDYVAVVTDAGTPGISDPGERLVRAALDAGFEVSSVPGPTALVAALVTSGLATRRFVFEGFLPRSGAPRRQRLAELADERRTIIVYEAPHRVVATLADLAAALGEDRPVAVARELTKLWETVVRGTLGSVELGSPRGEYVLVIAGAPDASAPPDDDEIRRALRAELARGVTARDAAGSVARRLGVPKRLVYDLAVAESRGARAATLAGANRDPGGGPPDGPSHE